MKLKGLHIILRDLFLSIPVLYIVIPPLMKLKGPWTLILSRKYHFVLYK